VTVSCTIPAPAEKVFDVWMDPKSPGGPWFGGDRVILNPIVYGLFYFALKHEGRTWPHYGRSRALTSRHANALRTMANRLGYAKIKAGRKTDKLISRHE
jgi:hypothetical protein